MAPFTPAAAQSTLRPARLAMVGVAALVATLYGPVLRLPPLAEDVQWALRGAAIARDPADLLTPFHQHWRPAVDLFFAAVSSFDYHWTAVRSLHLLLGAVLFWLAFLFTRKLPIALTGVWLVLAVWLASPLSSDVFILTSHVIQVLYAIGVLVVLWARSPDPSWQRRSLTALGAGLAMAAKEEWVSLVPLVFLQDSLLFRLGLRASLRRLWPWLGATAMYGIVYAATAKWEAGWFYGGEAAEFACKLAYTLATLIHTVPPLPLHFARAVASNPLPVAAGCLLWAAVGVLSVRFRAREALFCFAASIVALLPTLPSTLQAARYMFLPWFFFLAGVGCLTTVLGQRRTWGGFVTTGVVVAGLSVLANGVATVRGDIQDWKAHGAISNRLLEEAQPLIEAARAGNTLIVVRGQDDGPLRELVRSPSGKHKLYFPRPDDPYGVVSLSALLSWRVRREGWVLERVPCREENRPWILFGHQEGGFFEIFSERPPRIRFPGVHTEGVPGVILVSRRWTDFKVSSFP